jgi:hypothetical protein
MKANIHLAGLRPNINSKTSNRGIECPTSILASGRRLQIAATCLALVICALSISTANAGLTVTSSDWTSTSSDSATVAGAGSITSGTIQPQGIGNHAAAISVPTTGGNTAGPIASGGSFLLFSPHDSSHLASGNGQFVLTLSVNAVTTISSIEIAYNRGDATESPTAINWTVNTGSGTISSTTLSSSTGWQDTTLTLNSLQTTASSLQITATFTGGASGMAGTLAFDDIRATAVVPEPNNIALACFGLGFVVIGFSRCCLKGLRASQIA